MHICPLFSCMYPTGRQYYWNRYFIPQVFSNILNRLSNGANEMYFCMQSGFQRNDKTVFMMTSSNGNIFRVTGPLWGEFTGHLLIPLTKASDGGFDVFLDLCLNKRSNKPTRHDVTVMTFCNCWYTRRSSHVTKTTMTLWLSNAFRVILALCHQSPVDFLTK